MKTSKVNATGDLSALIRKIGATARIPMDEGQAERLKPVFTAHDNGQGGTTMIDQFGRDEAGRDVTTPEVLKEQLRQEALADHKGDMGIRFDRGNFPTSNGHLANTRDFVFENDLRQPGQGGFDLSRKVFAFSMAEPKAWLWLHGTFGSGKTTIATRMAKEWLDSDPMNKAFYVSISRWALDIFKKTEADKSEDSRIADKLTSRAKTMRGVLVVIDDLDKIHHSEWMEEQLFAMLNALTEANIKVIFTAQSSPREFAKKSKKPETLFPLIDRLLQRCLSINKGPTGGVFAFDNQSFRTNPAPE